MNVGSILNNDSPPSDHEQEILPVSAARRTSQTQSVHQRHSIVNILNDPPPEPERQTSFVKPVPAPSAHLATSIKSNSIANITNDRDVDISTGRESTINVSRTSSAQDLSFSSLNQSPVEEKEEKFSGRVTENEKEEIKAEEQRKVSNTATAVDEVVKEEVVSKPEKQNNQKPEVANNKNGNTYKDNDPASKQDVDELTRIKQLRKSRKPKRYTVPPIWAQEWIPPNRAHLIDSSDIGNQNGQSVRTTLSDKPVFDYTSTRSVDLQCSITGVIPPPSLTRTMAEWIFANFSNIEERNRKYVELELKFGKIVDKRTGNRINLSVITECIFTDHSSVHFDMQVEEIAWNEIRKFFEELEKSYQEDTRGQARERPRRKFNMLDTDITDSIYQVGGKGEHIRRIRISKDNSLNPPRYTAIEKTRVADMYIHNPSNMYDLRLSLSLELPVPEGNIEGIMAKNKPSIVREKKRNTWTHSPTITQFDLTRVLVPREAKNKHGKKITNHDINFEVEMEIDTLEVFNAIDKITLGTDTFRLEELVEVFVNNARVLNNRVTKLALP